MSTKNFVVKNGLTVGPANIDATSGTILSSGNVSVTGNLVCNNTYSNIFYLYDVLTTPNKPMQLFRYCDNVYVCTLNSNSTVSLFLETKHHHHVDVSLLLFSQAGATINSSLLQNNT